MVIFDWEDNLSIGIETIDGQHRELIRRLNKLAESVLAKQGKNRIGMTLKFMKNYGEEHFTSEEDFMARNSYPQLDEHKRQHEKFLVTTTKLIRELDYQKDMEHFASSVQRFLIDWLILHIRTSDRQFGIFLKGNI
jgi:hemerythrin